jgi:hypothetical protein
MWNRTVALPALIAFVFLGHAAAQSGCVATFWKGGGISQAQTPWCQGQVTHPTYARIDPNCPPFSTNGTFGEAQLSPAASGSISLASHGLIRVPNFDCAVFGLDCTARASGDIRYFGPAADLTVTLQIYGQRDQNGLPNHNGAWVKCGPNPEVEYALPLPSSSTLNTTLTKTFHVTNGATFDLSCRTIFSTSGCMSVNKWVSWSFSATLINATINLSGQTFSLGSASHPIIYWPTASPASVTPFGQACSNGAGAPSISAVGSPAVGNGAFGIDVTVPATSVAILAIGITPVTPVMLGNGCFFLTSNDLILSQPSVNGSALFSFPIPPAAYWLGATFEVQGANLDFATFEISTSSALRVVIGY